MKPAPRSRPTSSSRRRAPNVAVLDVRLPDGDGIEVCRDIRSEHPEIACLMLTSFADDEAVFSAILAGAAGYVLKQVRGTDLVDAVRRVGRGESILDPFSTDRVLERLRQPPEPDELSGLTNQERRVLDLIAEGMTNRQIGEQLFLAEKTVKNYVSNLLAKLGMSRRAEAAAYAAAPVRTPAAPRSPALSDLRPARHERAGAYEVREPAHASARSASPASRWFSLSTTKLSGSAASR